MQYDLKDSGDREAFDTGAQRDTRSGKGRFDLISPIMLQRLAIVMEKGAEKYGAHNWEKGMPVERFIDSALRHINHYLTGARDEDHLTQAIFNLTAIIHFETLLAAGTLSGPQKKIIFGIDGRPAKSDNGVPAANSAPAMEIR